ncbi:unnamed protein product [Knipowitschia caucasica]|uniref:RING-type E3 ubiquitin transferase n=1 Tax=Knipowitschia caucasica TaxID=637954 RepID=A0AAV2L214_KNICA
METLSQDSSLECQICFNYFSPRRRPKLLSCRHTLCSVCLGQMRSAHKEIRCPWCRSVTKLPPGRSISHLPDDPDIVAIIAVPHEHSPVFIRLPSHGCYMLPLPGVKDRGLGLPGDCRFVEHQKAMAVVAIPDDAMESLSLGDSEHRGAVMVAAGKGSAWSGVCTVVLVACVLLFLLGIVLHNMSCISKRFTVISCG